MEKKRKSGEGTGFIDSVKSGEFMDNLKLSLEQLKGGNRQVLPDELKKKMEALDSQAEAFMEAQKKAEEEAMKLKRLTAALCTDAIAMYKPSAESKPKPAATSDKPAEESKPAESAGEAEAAADKTEAAAPTEAEVAAPTEAEATAPPAEDKSDDAAATSSEGESGDDSNKS